MGNTTSGARFRAGLPAGWVIGDKTGTGDYASANDVGVAWTTHGTPLALAVLSSKDAVMHLSTTRSSPTRRASWQTLLRRVSDASIGPKARSSCAAER